jgi:DNA-directed RNA polymerase specialized sigma24 family protein
MCYRDRFWPFLWTAEPAAMLTHPEMERGWRFREAALPHLNAVYTMARYLTRDSAEAEYAVQECFVRGLRRFDLHSGDDMKPWLLGILRYFCKVELRPRGKALAPRNRIETRTRRALRSWWRQLQPKSLRYAGAMLEGCGG